MSRKKKSNHYFVSDGNGGFSVSKSITVGTLIMFLFLIVQVVYASGVASNKLDAVEKKFDAFADVHTDLDKELDMQGKKVAVLEEKIDNIDRNVNDIKEILKEHD